VNNGGPKILKGTDYRPVAKGQQGTEQSLRCGLGGAANPENGDLG